MALSSTQDNPLPDESTTHQVKTTGKIILYLSDKNGGDDQGGEEEQVVRICRQLLIWWNLQSQRMKRERVYLMGFYRQRMKNIEIVFS